MSGEAAVTKHEQAVTITAGRHRLAGMLVRPVHAVGVVAFAHGSGSGRFSPRNQFVARILQESGLATLLLDLLEDYEADDRDKVFDIGLLAERLQSAGTWLQQERTTSELPLGYFGASTGAAAALVAAARQPDRVSAVVSRGGRPDLAADFLPAVQAPTLFIVGGDDEGVLELNEQAFEALSCEKHLSIVRGATHLFPEPGALEQVADLAQGWFNRHFSEFVPKHVRRVR